MRELHRIAGELRECLEQGWVDFRKSDAFKELACFSRMLREAGYYESSCRNSIPHPAYDHAATLIGKRVPLVCRRLGIHFHSIFPGEFSESREEPGDRFEVRIFFLDVFKESKKIGRLSIAFPHVHDKFDLPRPPTVQVEQEIEPER